MKGSTLHDEIAAGASRISTRVRGTASGASGAPRSRRAHRAAAEAGERERRELQARGDALRAELAASERRRAELLSLIAHDLKSPLTPLLLCVKALIRAIPPDHAARRNVELAVRAADELGAAVDELSDLAGLALGHLPIADHLAPAGVGEMIAEALEATRRRVADRRVDVAVADGLPAVVCVRHRLVRVLVELMSRALRVTGRDAVVAVRARGADDGAVVISVTDGGPAVPEAHRAAFFALPASSTQQRATGQERAISLHVARGLVEAQGGRMEMESEDGRGTTVSLTLAGDEAVRA